MFHFAWPASFFVNQASSNRSLHVVPNSFFESRNILFQYTLHHISRGNESLPLFRRLANARNSLLNCSRKLTGLWKLKDLISNIFTMCCPCSVRARNIGASFKTAVMVNCLSLSSTVPVISSGVKIC